MLRFFFYRNAYFELQIGHTNEKLLKFFVAIIYTELFKAIAFEYLETVYIKYSNHFIESLMNRGSRY